MGDITCLPFCQGICQSNQGPYSVGYMHLWDCILLVITNAAATATATTTSTKCKYLVYTCGTSIRSRNDDSP